MSQTLGQHRIRLKLDPMVSTPLVCQLSGVALRAWRGTDVYVECGLYYGGVFVSSLTGLATLALDLVALDEETPLVQKTLAAGALNATLTENEWLGKAADKYHGRFALTHEETQLDMSAAVQNQIALRLVVHAVFSSGAYATLGVGVLTVEEDGAQNGLAVVSSASPSYRLRDGNIEWWNPDQSAWQVFGPRGDAGAEHIGIAAAEA